MIREINLINFRNHKKSRYKFNKNKIYITGKNGTGKTSILESIYYISNIRSHRTNNDLDLIKKGESFSFIKIITNKKTYTIAISSKGKIASINNKEIKRLSDFLGELKVVMFSPEDMELIKGSPSVRRNFIDIEISKNDKIYMKTLGEYKKILRERNAILKEYKESNSSYLNIIDKKIIELGKIIIKARHEFIKILNKEIEKQSPKFTAETIKLNYEYEDRLNDFINHINKNRKQDIIYKTTTKGPHRDDIEILFREDNAKFFASQGQQRLLIIIIKLSLLEIIKKDNEVILLLDDIFSELDRDIQNKILKEIPNDIQIIMNSVMDIKNDNFQIIELKENEE